jgi:SAM-dependent methyltransferase
MRHKLHAHYARVFRPGQRVLDVGCGTGIDAIALARLGLHVVGVDGSAAMIARLNAKVASEHLADRIQAHVLRIQDLAMVSDGPPPGKTIGTGDARGDRLDEAPFDGIISAFASLNSLPDLADFANDAARLVRPGGRVVLHMLNRFSSWEWLGYMARRDWRAARAVGRQRDRAFVIGGEAVQHAVYFADAAYRQFFSEKFAKRANYGLGALRPPHTVRRVPSSLVGILERLDVRLGAWPLLRNAGRFFVLDLERRPA